MLSITMCNESRSWSSWKNSAPAPLVIVLNHQQCQHRRCLLPWGPYPLSCFDTTFSLISWFTGYISLISYLYLLSLSDLTNTAILIDGWKVYLLHKPTSPPITDWWLALCDTSLLFIISVWLFSDCQGRLWRVLGVGSLRYIRPVFCSQNWKFWLDL